MPENNDYDFGKFFLDLPSHPFECKGVEYAQFNANEALARIIDLYREYEINQNTQTHRQLLFAVRHYFSLLEFGMPYKTWKREKKKRFGTTINDWRREQKQSV